MRAFFLILLWLYSNIALAGGFGGDGFGQPGFFQYVQSAPPSTNNLITPIFSFFLPVNNTNNQLGAVSSGSSTANGGLVSSAFPANRRVPIPIAGTLSGLAINHTGTVTGGTGPTVTSNINGTAKTLTCAFAAGHCTDTSHSDTFAAGDLLQWTFNPGGGTWAETTNTPSQISYLLTASSGQQGAILTGPNSAAASTTTTEYYNLGSGGVTSATEINASSLFEGSYSITGIWEIPNVADTGANVHTITIYHNGSATGMTCTNGADALGCCVNTTGTGFIGGSGVKACSATAVTALSIGPNDTVSIQVSCGGTCASISPGFGIAFAPSTTNQVPLFAQSLVYTAPTWFGLSDNVGSSALATQTAWQIAPALTTPSTITFSNYTACSGFNPGGTATRTMALQYSSSLIPPATSAGPAVTYGLGQNCGGYIGGVWAGGLSDTTHTFAAMSGYTLDTALTVSGSPASGASYKISQTVTVP